ncbi:MAG: hypothetical protein ACLQBD_27500 [Syntrophobacteraceae bacterium]
MPSMRTLKELANTGEDLTHTKPRVLIIGVEEINVNNWDAICLEVVKWLRSNGYFDVTKCPVPDWRGMGKYFVNTEQRHENPDRKGRWKRSGPFWVDVKYNVNDQVNNICSLLRHLRITDPGIKIEMW